MPSEPLTPEEIAQMRARQHLRELLRNAGTANAVLAEAEADLARLLESHEALRQENERLSALDDTAMWQQAEADLAVAREVLERIGWHELTSPEARDVARAAPARLDGSEEKR